ncbi:FAD-dependent oxidoreductase [Halioxenophilus sp. WMMB6]|uniref:FAD-dependent oxidoreductase n=1 Tax=Halioxenophilus sp. WMMB6 TaxID=3073815 RepID=UPI00295EFD81|nr:FAD-dependent oxidoreductase [Halioxenophilus sp. WMMB6]
MNNFDEVFDFVVVGSGAGGMSAALFAATRNSQVVMLEKSDLIGGSTARSGGVMWIPNNRFLKRDGIEESYDKAKTYLDNLTAANYDTPGSTEIRKQTYLQEAPQMLDFLVEQGIKIDRYKYWPDYYDERPGGLECGRSVGAELFNINELGEWKAKMRPGFLDLPARVDEALLLPNFKRCWLSFSLLLKVMARAIGAKLTGKEYVGAGAALQARMLQANLKAGVDVRTESPVTELIIEEQKVVGVVTTKDGQPWRIAGKKGVLINAGGFAHNQAMRDQYLPGTQELWTSAAPTDTGEMLQEMVQKGAAIAQMDEMVGNQCTLPPGSRNGDIRVSIQSSVAKPHAILVDQSGLRYMNEGGSYMAFCKGMLERNKSVPAVPSWMIFDSQYMKKYMLAGTMPGSKKPQQWYDSGYLQKAESLEQLAQLLEVDATNLQLTVERFNGFVHNNDDKDFQRGQRAYDRWLGDFLHKPNGTLGTIEKGPFYAIPVVPGDVSTYGGVVTDEHARVLRGDGSVIEGLYASGVSTASVMGRVYPGAGASIGPAYTFGYLAAKHALTGA